MPVYISLQTYQTTVFVIAMIFLAIGLWVGHALGKDNRFRRDSKGRFIR